MPLPCNCGVRKITLSFAPLPFGEEKLPQRFSGEKRAGALSLLPMLISRLLFEPVTA
jgi:hypothetical protein